MANPWPVIVVALGICLVTLMFTSYLIMALRQDAKQNNVALAIIAGVYGTVVGTLGGLLAGIGVATVSGP